MDVQIKSPYVPKIYGLQDKCKNYENSLHKQPVTHAFLPRTFPVFLSPQKKLHMGLLERLSVSKQKLYPYYFSYQRLKTSVLGFSQIWSLMNSSLSQTLLGKLKMPNNFARDSINFQKVTDADDFLPSLQMSSVEDMFLEA